MSEVTKPIALDESLNTTEVPSRNVADVLAEELQNIAQAIGGGGSGGHVIVDASDTDMPQRASMQFLDAGVTDDAVDDATKIEIVQEISAESDLNSAPDGVYQGTWDEDPSDALTADMVGMDDGTGDTVKDRLTWKLVGSETGNNTLTVPNTFREIMVISKYQQGRFIKIIPFEQFTDYTMQFFDGGFLTAANNASAAWYYRNGTIRLNWVSWGDSTVDLNNATTYLYYR